ncbi:MAG: hypothetical protein IPN70_02630 [Candidatus Moraniibacteriota bacterium]|nr:MAG: hypothetical protein IPN70_02630 [Candidatus Moranbacteria bacterium]
MEQNEAIERIQKFLEKILEKADLKDCSVEVSTSSSLDDVVIFNIQSSGPANILIGQSGENLRSLQYIIRLLVRKHLFHEDQFPFLIDINGYRQQKDKLIFDVIDQAAQEAKTENKAVSLRPMSAYERRLVHLRLSQNEDVVTESVGEGEKRKVIIRPVGGKK